MKRSCGLFRFYRWKIDLFMRKVNNHSGSGHAYVADYNSSCIGRSCGDFVHRHLEHGQGRQPQPVTNIHALQGSGSVRSHHTGDDCLVFFLLTSRHLNTLQQVRIGNTQQNLYQNR